MKNQNDLIITIVSLVLALIIVGVLYGTKPQAKTEVSAAKVPIADAVVTGAEVKMASGLGSGGAAGGRTGALGRPGGGPPSMGGPGGAPSRPMGTGNAGGSAPARPMGTGSAGGPAGASGK